MWNPIRYPYRLKTDTSDERRREWLESFNENKREEWKSVINKVKVSKVDMNELVMDFMVTEGYVDAAEKFRSESGTQLGVDHEVISDCLTLMKELMDGNVEDVFAKLSDSKPELLGKETQLLFRLLLQKLTEIILSGKVDQALEFAQKKLALMAAENVGLSEELEKTMTLLLFQGNPNSSFDDELLLRIRRHKTANEINKKILTLLRDQKDPKLLVLLKTLMWIQEQNLYEVLPVPEVPRVLPLFEISNLMT